MFNAIGILLITMVVGNAIFFSWLFYKIRSDERKDAAKQAQSGVKSGCGCKKCKDAAARGEAGDKTGSGCSKCKEAAARGESGGKTGCGCNKQK
jgi:hypothetical protein